MPVLLAVLSALTGVLRLAVTLVSAAREIWTHARIVSDAFIVVVLEEGILPRVHLRILEYVNGANRHLDLLLLRLASTRRVTRVVPLPLAPRPLLVVLLLVVAWLRLTSLPLRYQIDVIVVVFKLDEVSPLRASSVAFFPFLLFGGLGCSLLLRELLTVYFGDLGSAPELLARRQS